MLMRLILGGMSLLIFSSASDARCMTKVRFHFTSEGPWSGYGVQQAVKSAAKDFERGQYRFQAVVSQGFAAAREHQTSGRRYVGLYAASGVSRQ
jgi:hypothetical protein